MVTDEHEDDADDQVYLLDLLDEHDRVRVNKRRCGTCIYFDENRMCLDEGRREQMEADAIADDSFIPCHQTIPASEYDAPPAICNGFWHEGQGRERSWPLRFADQRGAVVRVEPPSTAWKTKKGTA